MALFTDGPINDAAHLQNYENSILQVANTEQIDLAGKGALAQAEIASELELFFLRRLHQRDFEFPIISAPTVSLRDVVLTEALRRWHAHRTLALVYRDAYNNQLNDRYKGKWSEYEQLSRESRHACFTIGVGLVSNPIPKAPLPMLTAVPGPGDAATYYVSAAWVNSSGQAGGASDAALLTTFTGQRLQVAMGAAPSIATGWNVYVGLSPDEMSPQNTSPIPPADSWTLAQALLTGPAQESGQHPQWFLRDERVIERG